MKYIFFPIMKKKLNRMDRDLFWLFFSSKKIDNNARFINGDCQVIFFSLKKNLQDIWCFFKWSKILKWNKQKKKNFTFLCFFNILKEWDNTLTNQHNECVQVVNILWQNFPACNHLCQIHLLCVTVYQCVSRDTP